MYSTWDNDYTKHDNYQQKISKRTQHKHKKILENNTTYPDIAAN